MTEKFTEFDAAEFIDDKDAAEFFMADAIEAGDVSYIIESLADIARSPAMLALTQQSGVTSEQLQTMLAAEKNPTVESVIALMKSIGLGLEST